MSAISDFTDTEQRLVTTALFERYDKLVLIQLADSELQLDASSDELVLYPTIYWAERDAHFVVCKTAAERFRCRFFYSESDQYGTGRVEYDSLVDCVATLLQVQSEHERQLANVSASAPGNAGEDDYHGSTVI